MDFNSARRLHFKSPAVAILWQMQIELPDLAAVLFNQLVGVVGQHLVVKLTHSATAGPQALACNSLRGFSLVACNPVGNVFAENIT